MQCNNKQNIERLGEPYGGILWGNPPPTRVYMEVIEKAVAGYLYYHYDVLKRNQIFYKI